MTAPATWTTPVVHADLDAFYAAAEVLRDPSLAGKPVIVGGTSNRGVVTSPSYEARRFGVASGMPTSRARRLCPGAIFLTPDFDAYRAYSERVRQVFEEFSPVVEPLSMDEAFIDVSSAVRLWPSPAALGEALRERVRARTGLAVSAGIAPNKFLAKLASRRAKPDGIVVVEPEEVPQFLDPLPVEELWGVGEHTSALLRRLGLGTIGDISRVPAQTLELALPSWGAQLARMAAGRDDRRVVAGAAQKSMGAEETFERDLAGTGAMLRAVLGLCDRVASRMRAQGVSGRTVTLKVRFSSFKTVTRAETLPSEADSAMDLYGAARGLLEKALKAAGPAALRAGPAGPGPAAGAGGYAGSVRVRLLGVSVSQLVEWPSTEQLCFEARPRWAQVDPALDRVRARFGKGAVGFASLLETAREEPPGETGRGRVSSL